VILSCNLIGSSIREHYCIVFALLWRVDRVLVILQVDVIDSLTPSGRPVNLLLSKPMDAV
jgi:hypothetical protein